jgi:hypothetical protein
MTKTTLTIDPLIYKMVRRIALEQNTTVSSIVRDMLLLYISDPEGVAKEVGRLKEKDLVGTVNEEGEVHARDKGDYYIDWDKVQFLTVKDQDG